MVLFIFPFLGMLPELASYLSPISEYMASMLPPKVEYAKHQGSIKPPTKDYLAPAKGSKLQPPSHEYLTPFKPLPKEQKHPKLLPIFPPKDDYKPPEPSIRPPQFLRAVCPPAKKNVKCEYEKNQCWSPGIPDEDCPGHGLCCFNGCINACLPAPSGIPIFSNFHVPPNGAYLIPGQEYLFLEALASKRRNEEGIDQLSQEYLPPMYSLAVLDNDEISGLPNKPPISQLPRGMYPLAVLDTAEVSGLPNRPSVSELPRSPTAQNLQLPTEYKPPAKEYLPPPQRQYPVPVDGYRLPAYEGAELSDIQRPNTQYIPPNVSLSLIHI